LRGDDAAPQDGGVSGKSATKAVRVIGAIDERHKLHADVPPRLPPGAVHLFVLPMELGQGDSSESGQEFEVERADHGEYRFVPNDTSANGGTVDWLLACPEKDFFVPIQSESTDTI
jgi:hypothetical protein